MKYVNKNLVEVAKIFVRSYEENIYNLMGCMVLTPDTVDWSKLKELRESFNTLTNYGYLEKSGHDSYKLGYLGFEELRIFIRTGKTKEERKSEKGKEIQDKNLNRKIRLEILEWSVLIISIVNICLEIKTKF